MLKDRSMLLGARQLVNTNAGLQPGEKALVVCDTENISIAEALVEAIKEVPAEYTMAVMEPRSTHGENPTDAISAAMLAVDVVFAPTKFSLSHSQAREEANAKGVRFISMPDYTEDMLRGGALEADFLEIYKTVLKLKDMLTACRNIHITTPLGTDIYASAEGRIGNEVSGVCRGKGTWGSPPNIEVNVSPIEDKTHGVVMADGSIPMPGIGVLKKPFRMVIENGRIASCEKTEESDAFLKLLDGEVQPCNKVLAEVGIGLNNKAVLRGAMLDDEGAYGTAHFGFGHNFDQGGQNKATRHIDVVYRNPTIELDGVVIMKDGKLTV